MTKIRAIALALVTAALSVGTLGVTAPAHADTSWPCPTCFTTSHLH